MMSRYRFNYNKIYPLIIPMQGQDNYSKVIEPVMVFSV